MSENEREIRALEAIIASQLLRERDPMNLDDLPKLTENQRIVMNALPADFVEQLWNEVEKDFDMDCSSEATSMVCEEEFVGMNRAEDMTEETRQALDQARKEVMESMNKWKEQNGANN